jgi:hypothetical protein
MPLATPLGDCPGPRLEPPVGISPERQREEFALTRHAGSTRASSTHTDAAQGHDLPAVSHGFSSSPGIATVLVSQWRTVVGSRPSGPLVSPQRVVM